MPSSSCLAAIIGLVSRHRASGRRLLVTITQAVLWLSLAHLAQAQHRPGFNYDEAKIPPYTLLDPLRLSDGKPVTTAKQWTTKRRPEILRLFKENVFGKTPGAALHARGRVRVLERDDHALDGLAIREQVEITFDLAPNTSPAPDVLRSLRLLVYLPATAREHRAPLVLGVNFFGNQTVLDDPAIQPTDVWSPPKDTTELHRTTPADSTRGASAHQWQVKLLLERGYGFATFYCGDLEPDYKGGARYSVRQLFRPTTQATEAPDRWGAFGAWAWGLSRALDYLATDPLVDPLHIAVTGHSRLGKTADWAAAMDTRFAAVLSNESGHGGQSIQRRALGETVGHLVSVYGYWFAPAYAQWVGRDAEIPADGNLLLSLLAPRPVYVGSAVGDEWSDPHGEFLSAVSASRVYRLLGKPALAQDTPVPGLDQPVGLDGYVAYHDRTGKHDVTRFDWEHYIQFLDNVWGKPAGVAHR